jgi:hypothetical protein
MKSIVAALALGLIMAAAHAKLPAAPPVSDADKAAKAQTDAAAKAKEAEELGRAQDKAVSNYKKNKNGAAQTKK